MRRFLLLAALGLTACATGGMPPPDTVDRVDLARYEGRWYEIARFPNSFQDGRGRRCVGVTADYAREPDGTVSVVNRCRNAMDDGREIVARGWARASDGSNAKLRVTFFWPFFGDYWVIALDPQYRWAVVGTPDRENLWVLARRPEMSAGAYSAAIGMARAEGFITWNLVPTVP